MHKPRSYLMKTEINHIVSFTDMEVDTILTRIAAVNAEAKRLMVYYPDGTLDRDASMERALRATFRHEIAKVIRDILPNEKRHPNVKVGVWPRGVSNNLMAMNINQLENVLAAATTPTTDAD